MNVIHFQYILFPQREIQRPDKLVGEIEKIFGDIFGMPVMSPMPDQIKVTGVPLVQMNSAKNNFSIGIGSDRITLTINNPEDISQIHTSSDNFLESTKPLIEKFNKCFFTPAYSTIRLGFVISTFVKSGTPDADIVNHYFQGSVPRNANEIIIRYNHAAIVNGLNTNDVITIGSGKASSPQLTNEIDGITILRDINNVIIDNTPIGDKEYDILQTHAFSEFAVDKMKRLI